MFCNPVKAAVLFADPANVAKITTDLTLKKLYVRELSSSVAA
jgi:hypothetical protein